MKNIKLIVQYIGTNYCGFQKQKNGISIQEIMEKAISEILGEDIKLYPSGRTDAGVHALGQVVNYFTTKNIEVSKLPIIFNLKLPKDIKVLSAEEVASDFNSRKSAKSKTYIYKIFNGKIMPVFDENRCLYCKYKLNLDIMQKATKMFVGEHDFASFVSGKTTTKTTIRKIFDCSLTQQGEYITFSVTGNGFLYNMVRIIVGTIIDVGRGKLSLYDLQNILSNPCRAKAGKTVSPDGLYLKTVQY